MNNGTVPSVLNTDQLLVRLDACLLKPFDVAPSLGADGGVSLQSSEVCGTVLQLGHRTIDVDIDGNPIIVGTRVVWSSRSSCGECFCCQAGFSSHCLRHVSCLTEGTEMHAPVDNPGPCRLIRDDMNVLVIPTDVPPGIASLIPGSAATASAILKRIGTPCPGKVLIAGAGMTSVILAAMLKAEGAEDVILVERRANRRTVLKEAAGVASFSMDEAYGEIAHRTGGFGVDVAINLTRQFVSLDYLLPLIRLGGTLLFHKVHPGSRRERFTVSELARRQLTVKGLNSYHASDLIDARRFLIRNHQLCRIGSLIQSLHLSPRDSHAARRLKSSQFFRVGVMWLARDVRSMGEFASMQ